MSTLHVKPLSGPGNLPADEPHEHSSLAPPFSPIARLLWHLQRALHLARDVSTLLEGGREVCDDC